MSGNMIERLGLDWCNQRMVGGNFVYGDKVLRVAAVRADHVLCEDSKTGDRSKLPLDFFTGFKVFKYPALGYRSYGPGLAVWLYKRHSYHRGLREQFVQLETSPVSSLLCKHNAQMLGALGALDRPGLMELVFFPKYHTLADMERLYEGDLACVVLNENVLIEPNVVNDNADGYTVYFKRRPCAAIDLHKHKLHWYSKAYKNALSPIFNQG